MIKLYQYPANLGLANASPFCLKLETWLRIAGLDYEVVNTADPRKTPMGKLPVIEHEGKQVADSSCAIAYLQKACAIQLDTSLNPGERGAGHALRRMLEEHTYWALIYFRWLDEDGWKQTREAFFGHLTGMAQRFLPGLVRKKIRRDALGHGLSLHSKDEILRRFGEDMRALADYLGEKPYFGGYQATTIDATAYGFLAQILLAEPATPLLAIAQEHPALVAFTERMHARYFPAPSS